METTARRTRAVAAGVGTTVGLLVVASVLIFALIRSAPGDPVDVEFGASGVTTFLTPEEEADVRAERRAELGLDKSIVEQYARWLIRVVQGDFGLSYQSGTPVADEVFTRLPASLALGALGFAIAIALAAAVAVLSARRPGGALDHVLRISSISVAAVPTFLSGSLALRWMADGIDYPIAGPASLERIWLPALVMGLSGVPTLARVLRSALIAEAARPHALAARARGATPARVMFRHVLRPASTPVLTLAGLALAALLGGAVITEVVFSWPGVGAYAIEAIHAQDYPIVQAYVLVMTFLVVVVNRSVDLLQHLLDPRAEARARSVE